MKNLIVLTTLCLLSVGCNSKVFDLSENDNRQEDVENLRDSTKQVVPPWPTATPEATATPVNDAHVGLILLAVCAIGMSGCVNSPTSYNLAANIGYNRGGAQDAGGDAGSVSTGKVDRVWIDTQGGGQVDAESDVGLSP